MASDDGETPVQSEILRRLQQLGVVAWRNPTQGQIRWGADGNGLLTGAPAVGLADILGILPGGKALMVEVKKPGWKPPRMPAGYDDPAAPLAPASKAWVKHANQKWWIDTCNRLGGIALFATSWREVEEQLMFEGVLPWPA